VIDGVDDGGDNNGDIITCLVLVFHWRDIR